MTYFNTNNRFLQVLPQKFYRIKASRGKEQQKSRKFYGFSVKSFPIEKINAGRISMQIIYVAACH